MWREEILPTIATLLLATSLAAGGCAGAPTPAPTPAPAPPGPEAVSRLGRPLYPMTLAPDVRGEREEQLRVARRAWEADPDDETAIIWYGRRTAYLGRYREAIAIYTEGLARHPDSYRLLRHRGHRHLTVRELDEAIADLRRAAELSRDEPDETEPDGLPNRRGIPTSTTRSNIHYHLGLAHYLQAQFDAARASYERGMDFALNDDMRCAMTYWWYLSLRRLGREGDAARVLNPVRADMDIIENRSYHQLLLLFKGELAAEDVVGGDAAVGAAIDDATIAYGLGMWHRLAGRAAEARAIFERLASGPAWPAFGAIAAEAELARTE